MSFTLGNIVSNLPAKSGGRNSWGNTADGSFPIIQAQQAVMEITETAELEELKYQTPVPPQTGILQMSVGVPVTPISTILATIATNANYPQFSTIATQIVDITDVFTYWIWFGGGVNSAGRTLEYRRITTLDMYTYGVTSNSNSSFGVAPPVYYSRFGSNLQVGPAPDRTYFNFLRVQLRHPFPTSSLAAAPIFAPASWQEAFEYATILKLAAGEGIQDSSIYKTAKDWLESRGMAPWQRRTLQQMRDERHNARALSLRTAVYTYR